MHGCQNLAMLTKLIFIVLPLILSVTMQNKKYEKHI